MYWVMLKRKFVRSALAVTALCYAAFVLVAIDYTVTGRAGMMARVSVWNDYYHRQQHGDGQNSSQGQRTDQTYVP